MNFKEIKWKISLLGEKATEIKNKTILFASEKISTSPLIINSQNELIDFINQSENKTYKNEFDWEKVFIKRVIIIIWDSKKDFFKDLILKLPIIIAKTFSQNLKLKLIDINNNELSLNEYSLQEFPTILVFENKKIYKKIIWEINLKKIVNDLSLDINKTVDEIE